jgi:cofilin
MINLKISQEYTELYNKFKIGGKASCLIFGLSANGSDLELLFEGNTSYDYNDIPNKLDKTIPVFVLYDYHYETYEIPPRKSTKIILICWCPDTVPVKKRFPFAAAKDALKNAFTGIQKEIQASDYSDIDYETVRKSFN